MKYNVELICCGIGWRASTQRKELIKDSIFLFHPTHLESQNVSLMYLKSMTAVIQKCIEREVEQLIGPFANILHGCAAVGTVVGMLVLFLLE